MREILLNPGPVSLSDRVRKAAVARDLCHRESEFFELQDSVRSGLLKVYGLDPQQWTAILLAGSGTAALEAMVSTLLPADARLMVVENGVYGERLSAIAAIHGIASTAVHFEWGELVDPALIEVELNAAPDTTHLALVHHETTTGRLNDVAAIAALCRERGVEILLDAVSSFGGEAIDFEGWSLTAVAATSNKCLHGIPGTAIVICRRESLEHAHPRTLYLDLVRYNKAQDKQSVPFTPGVPACLALNEALNELEEQGGWSARKNHYSALQLRVEQKLAELGVKPLLAVTESSAVLRAYHLPGDMDYQTLHDRLKFLGFVIYAGQGGLANSMFRISTMGDITAYDMNRLEGALDSAFEGTANVSGI